MPGVTCASDVWHTSLNSPSKVLSCIETGIYWQCCHNCTPSSELQCFDIVVLCTCAGDAYLYNTATLGTEAHFHQWLVPVLVSVVARLSDYIKKQDSKDYDCSSVTVIEFFNYNHSSIQVHFLSIFAWMFLLFFGLSIEGHTDKKSVEALTRGLSRICALLCAQWKHAATNATIGA